MKDDENLRRNFISYSMYMEDQRRTVNTLFVWENHLTKCGMDAVDISAAESVYMLLKENPKTDKGNAGIENNKTVFLEGLR